MKEKNSGGIKLPKCSKCNGTGKIEYYYDAGDHFGAGTSPDSEWRIKNCDCQRRK